MYNGHNGFYGITLINFGGLMEYQEGHFLTERFIASTQILNNIKVLGLEINNLGHEGIILHAFVLHIIKLIAILD